MTSRAGSFIPSQLARDNSVCSGTITATTTAPYFAGSCAGARCAAPSLVSSCARPVSVCMSGMLRACWLVCSQRLHDQALHGGGLRHAVLELGDCRYLHTDVQQWGHSHGLWRLYLRGGHAWRRLADLHRRRLSRKLGWQQCGHGLHLHQWLHRFASSS